MIIIGVDCATQEHKTGLAFGSFEKGRTVVEAVEVCSKEKPAVTQIVTWLEMHRGSPALLALDAPLGWPNQLRKALPGHQAGELLPGEAVELFSRETDRLIWNVFKKRPLEVGANLIARTAYSAVKLLHDLREHTNRRIPLAWEMGDINETCAIEVYPTATLIAHGIAGRNIHQQAIEKMGIHFETDSMKQFRDNPHARDSVLFVLAASDFLHGRCFQPRARDLKTARKEGWIWVKTPEPSGGALA